MVMGKWRGKRTGRDWSARGFKDVRCPSLGVGNKCKHANMIICIFYQDPPFISPFFLVLNMSRHVNHRYRYLWCHLTGLVSFLWILCTIFYVILLNYNCYGGFCGLIDHRFIIRYPAPACKCGIFLQNLVLKDG